MALEFIRRLFSSSSQSRRHRFAGRKLEAKQRHRRVLLESLEDRRVLATFNEAGTLLDLDLNVGNEKVSIVANASTYTLTLTGGTWSGANGANVSGDGTSVLTVTAAGLAVFDTVNITDSAIGIGVTFANSGANVYSDNFNVTLDQDTDVASGEQSVVFAGASNFGTFDLNVDTTRNIFVGSGASVVTSTGDISLRANVAATAAGDFVGIELNDADVTSTYGAIELNGHGGNSGARKYGVLLQFGATIASTGSGSSAGAISITGVGGSGAGTDNKYGVYLFRPGTKISSVSAPIVVIGRAGSGTSSGNSGISLHDGVIESTGTGPDAATITLDGTGGSGSAYNNGLYFFGAGTSITSASGDIRLTGVGGNGGNSHGVWLRSGANVKSTGTGGDSAAITISGTGTASSNVGVAITENGSLVNTIDGPVSVEGIGGGASGGGVLVSSTGVIDAGGLAAVMVTGRATGSSIGVDIDASVSSDAGNVDIVSADRLRVGGSGQIATASGAASLVANEVIVEPVSARIDAGSGLVSIAPFSASRPINLGSESGTSLSLTGAEVNRITAGTLMIGGSNAGAITISQAISPGSTSTLHLVTGGGVTQSAGITVSNLAVEAGNTVSLSSNNDADTVAIRTTAGNLAYSDSDGFVVGEVDGVAGVSSPSGSPGLTAMTGDIVIANTSAANDLEGGTGFSVNVTLFGSGAKFGVAGGASISGSGAQITANRMDFAGTLTATATVTLQPNAAGTLINLGSPADNTLELSAEELNRITAGTLRIGNSSAGAIAISQPVSPGGTSTLHLISGAGVTQTFTPLAAAAPITIANLAVEAGGTIDLQASGNDVDVVSLRTSSGSISFTDKDGFAVGTVDSLNGLLAAAGSVSLTAMTGDMQILNTPAAYDLDVASDFGLSVVLVGSEALLTLASGSAVRATGSGTYHANRMDLVGTTEAGPNRSVGLRPWTNGRRIDLGSSGDSAPNTLELSEAELDRITASGLLIGLNLAGPIYVSQAISPSTASPLSLTSAGDVTQAAGVAGIVVGGLAVTAGGPITLTNVNNNVSAFAAKATTGDIAYVDANNFNVGFVGSVQGVDADGGGVSLTSLSGNVQVLNISANNEVEATGSISFLLGGPEAQLTIGSSATLSSPALHSYQADKIDIQGAIYASDTVQLKPTSSARLIDLGGADAAGTLGLTDAELDRIDGATSIVIGVADSGPINITRSINRAAPTALHLVTGSSIQHTGSFAREISVAQFAAEAAGAITLDLNNNLSRVAARSTSGSVYLRSVNSLTATAVDGVNGVTAATTVTLNADVGNITIENTPAAQDIAAAHLVSMLPGTEAVFDLQTGAQITVSSQVDAIADKFKLAGQINAGTFGNVYLRSLHEGLALDLGSSTDSAPSTIELSDDELSRINANLVEVGQGSTATVVSAAIGAEGVRVLAVKSSGTISQSAPITQLWLIAEAFGSISLDADNDVDQLTLRSTTGQIAFRDVDGFLATRSDGNPAINAPAGSVALTALGGGIELNTSSPGNVLVAAGPVNITLQGNNSLFKLNASRTLSSGSSATIVSDKMELAGSISVGSVLLQPATSGRGIDLGPTTDLSAGWLELSDAELDRISAGTIEIGSSAAATIIVNADLTQPGKNLTLRTGAGVTGFGGIVNGSSTPMTVTINQAGNSTFNGRFGGTSGGTANDKNVNFVKQGAGRLTIAGESSHNGTTTISEGTLLIGGFSTLPATTAVTVAAGATWDLNATGGFGSTVGSLAGAGTVQLGNAPLTFGGNNASTTFSGEMVRNGQVIKTGSGVFTLVGAIQDGGNLTINGGTLRLGAADRIADDRYVSLGTTSATLDLNGFNETIGALDGGSSTVLLGTGTLIVGGLNVPTNLYSTISGTGGFAKTGNAAMTLEGANTFTGPTTVAGGTLLVNGSLAAGSAVTVQSGARLGGRGTINGQVIVESGGEVAPGTSLGVLRSGDTIFRDGSSFHVEIGNTSPGNDQLVVTGSVIIGSNVNLNLSSVGGFVPTVGQTFTIISNDGAGPGDHSGAFAGLPDGGVITNFFGSGLNAVITYSASNGNDGNDVVLRVVSPNQPPMANAGGPYDVDEGGSVSISGALSFDLEGAITGYEWDFDYDGSSFDVHDTGVTTTFSAAALDGQSTRSIALRVTDIGGLTHVGTTLITVKNQSPTATFNAASPVNEGSASALSLLAGFDPSSADTAAGFHYSFACDGNSGSLATTYSTASSTNTANCTFTDNGTFSVLGRILDKDDGFTTYDATVIVNNVAPTSTLTRTNPIREGESSTLTLANGTDLSSTDSAAGFRYSFACDGQDASLATTYSAAGASSTASCLFTDNRNQPFMIKGRIFDKDDGFTTYSSTIVVSSVAPTATFAAASPINEGGSSALSLTNPTDPSSDDTNAGFRYSFACDGLSTSLATTYSTASTTSATTCSFAESGSFTVRARIIDKNNSATSYSSTITVTNVAPSATFTATSSLLPWEPTLLKLSQVTDPSVGDTDAGLRYSFACDGDSKSLAQSYAVASTTSNKTCTFTSGGTYTVLGRVYDRDEGVSTSSAQVTVGWARQFGSALADHAIDVTTIGTDLYVTGMTRAKLIGGGVGLSNAGGVDVFLRKYDSSGSVVWDRQFGTTGDDSVVGIAADSSGIYVTGTLGNKAFLRKYDKDGAIRWTETITIDKVLYYYGESLVAQPKAITVLGSEIYVAGGIKVVGGRRNNQEGTLLRKFSAEGQLLRTSNSLTDYSTSGAHFANMTLDVATDGTNIYKVGRLEFWSSATTMSYSRATVFSETRDGRFHLQFFPPQEYLATIAAAADVSGVYTIVTTGSGNRLVKYGADGRVVWAIDAVEARDLSVDSSGIYVAGVENGTAYVRNYDSNGNQVWSKNVTGADSVAAIKTTLTNVYVAGSTGSVLRGQRNIGSTDAFVVKGVKPASTGIAVNGYIQGGTVYFDANKNVVLDDGEPFSLTDASGGFSVETSPALDLNTNGAFDDDEGQWVVFGGIDTSTGLPAATVMVAPGSWTIVSPLTTLVSSLVADYGLSADQATSMVISAFDLPHVDLRKFDPIAEAAGGNPVGATIFAVHAQVQDTIVEAATLLSGLEGAPARETLVGLVIGQIVVAIALADDTLDLTDAQVIGQILQETATESSLELSQDLLSGGSAVIAATNQQIEAIESTDGSDYLLEVAKIKSVAQGPVAGELAAAAGGDADIEDVVQQNTGEALTEQIASATPPPPTLIVPAEITWEATSASGAEVSFVVSANDFKAQLIEVTCLPASGSIFAVGTTTVTCSATDEAGTSTARSFNITVTPLNTPPVAQNDNFTVAEDGSISGNFLADDSDPDGEAVSIFAIGETFVGETQVIATAHGSITVNSDGTFAYTPGIGSEASSDEFAYVISDPRGGTATATVHIAITRYTGVTNVSGILRFGGGDGADRITVNSGNLIVNGTAHSLAGVTEVRIWGREGNDSIDLTGLTIPSFVHSGSGNDQITGGSADDVIFGGDGDDIMTGDAGHDFLVGGTGKDRIVGSAGHDILVSAEVAYWLSLGDMREISRTWKDSRTITQQAADDFIDESYGDADNDMLTGGSGADLFIISSGDKITDFKLDKSKTNSDGDVVIVDGVIMT